MKLPKVSILIPCYNAEKWVRQAIQSALDQTYENKEVIVVDDGSTDRSLEIIKSFGVQIKWETGPNKGGNVARNRLSELSSGEWLQYLDADDYLLPNKVNNQVKALLDDTDVIFSPSLMEYHHEKDITKQKVLQIPEPYDLFILLARWYLPQTGAPLWKKEAITEVGGWKSDQPVCQEHELYSRLVMADKKFQYFEKAESVYRQWGENTLWKKDQSFTRKHRLLIEDRLEKHLLESEEMSRERQWAINMARFETARSEWKVNKKSAIKYHKTIKGWFTPRGDAAPLKYIIPYVLFGFEFCENLADKLRR